ncbi:MAG TPA: hypothetical protein VFQ22_07975 [Longimicrobiales bacterium]|nr:hypothetical protein [Longimicrobiales bacterium]
MGSLGLAALAFADPVGGVAGVLRALGTRAPRAGPVGGSASG